MKQLAFGLSLFVALIGAIGVIRPEVLLGVARYFETPSGLYVAASLRIVLGIALLIAASASRAPRAIRVVGVVVLVAGLVTPLFGPERVRSIVDWWSSRDPLVMRVGPGFALALGCFLTWALLPKSRAA